MCVFSCACVCVMSGCRRRRTCCATVGQCLSYTSGTYRATPSIYLWGRLGDENFKQPNTCAPPPTRPHIDRSSILFVYAEQILVILSEYTPRAYLYTILAVNFRIYKYSGIDIKKIWKVYNNYNGNHHLVDKYW